MKIYIIYVMKYDPETQGVKIDRYERTGITERRERNIWWSPSLESLSKKVMKNALDMFEQGYYDYALIEELGENYMESRVVQWFKATYDPVSHGTTVEIIDSAPAEHMDDIVCWTIG